MNNERWHGREQLDLGTELLDRQITGPDGEAVGKVDDLELTTRDDGSIEVTALLVGTAALRERIPRGAVWMLSLGLRASGGPDEPRRVGLEQVTDLDARVQVSVAGVEAGASAAERRLRRFVARIPGAGDAGE